MRSPKRYIVFEVVSENKTSYTDVVTAIWDNLLIFLGENDTSKTRLWIIKNLYDEELQRGVIKCSHMYVEQLRVALSLISIIGETKATIKIIGVTGTIKSAKTKYLGGIS